MFKYQNALDKNDNIIHIASINTVNKQTLSPFRCVGCHSELIPALGNIREHHFKHKSNTHCSFETYLHKAAKLAVSKGLKKAIEENGNYWLSPSQSITCPNDYRKGACGNCGQRKARLNLARAVASVSVEKKAKGFIADVLAESIDEDIQIAIEICVSNPCSPEKIASGLSIIETKVSNETDVQQLYNGIPAGSADYNLPLINDITASHCLLPQSEPKPTNEITPKRTLILYDDGRLFILNQPFSYEFRDEILGKHFEYCVQKNSSGAKIVCKVLGAWGVTKALVDEQMVANVIMNLGRQKVRSCVGCKHFAKHGPNVLENITCKIRGAQPQYEALKCDLFDPK